MVTSEEIADVPLFASLTAADRERLSRACADIRLAAGEYAVHEGEERALFVVLEGRIEVVKLVDGIERVLGERLPGAIFGEVPITLGTSFPSGFRAAEASRVMHVDVTQYYAIAAAAPDVALKVGALARERIGGLQGVAAEPPKPRAHLVGHRWDAACSDLRRFLDRNQITFEWITPDAERRRRATGVASCRRTAISPRSVRAARRSSARRCARSPSCSGCRRAPPPRSTTRSSSAPGPPASPLRCTARPRACARS